jgi:formate C-acetyltransferase
MEIAEQIGLTYQQRLDALHQKKLQVTKEKQEIIGAMNYDDWGVILPPPEVREVTRAMSGSGVWITDVLLKGVEMESNHPSGGFFGAEIMGRNFRRFLKAHPAYLDPLSSLAGGYMAHFYSYRKVGWPEELRYPRAQEFARYHQGTPVGGQNHFCQDLKIGLDLGWGGLLNKIRFYREKNAPDHGEFYNGLEHIVLGMQDWIQRTATLAREMAATEENPQLRQNLEEMAEINQHLVSGTPRTFREACQWISWYQLMARMCCGSGSLGRLDVLLTPYYERDVAAGILTEEDAIFHVACLYYRETSYVQVGGPDADGHDVTNAVSFVCLEAAGRIRIPTNIGVSVGKNTDPRLLRRGVEILFQNRQGTPKFVGMENITAGYARNGIPPEIARLRAYSGCHWFALPGREYCLNDGAKVHLGAVLEVAWNEMWGDASATPGLDELWRRFTKHLEIAVDLMRDGYDYQVKNEYKVTPELALDLLCYGVIEKGLDASQAGGLDYINFGLDASALATVADSFAALEQRVEREQLYSWEQVRDFLASDWAGAEGERARLAMKNIPRFGHGGSLGDAWAVKVADAFTTIVKAKPTPDGHNVIPGFFSWALNIPMGQVLGATPNGRHAHAPISHGPNPDPGFRQDGAPTALAVAVAAVNPFWGNPAPMQLELDPGIVRDASGVDNVVDLIRTHMDLGGTEISLNILDKQQVLAAHQDPSLYPDLVVRVTGFSAYWSSLSKDFRQLVVDRIIAESV